MTQSNCFPCSLGDDFNVTYFEVEWKGVNIQFLFLLNCNYFTQECLFFPKWIFSNFCSFSISSQSCHCLMFLQNFSSPLHTYSTPFYSPLKINFASHLSSKIATEHSRVVHSNHLAENSWGYLQQNYEKSKDFPNYHFSIKDTPLSPSSKYMFKKTEDRYLAVLFAFEISSFQIHTIYVLEWENIHNQMNSECLPKYSSCFKLNNLCGVSVKISPYVCISSWHHSTWKKHCKASSFNTLLKMYLSLLDLLWQQNLGWGTAQRHCTIHSAAIHLTKESRRT